MRQDVIKITSKCEHFRGTHRTMTLQIIYTDKNTCSIEPKPLSKEQVNNLLDYINQLYKLNLLLYKI